MAEKTDRRWLRFYDPGVPRDIEVPAMTLPEVLRRTALSRGKAPATVFFGRRMDYDGLAREAARFASVLGTAGVKPRDRVALLFPNVPDEIIAYYGTMMAGAVVVQLNPLGTAGEMARAINDSGAGVLVALDVLLGKFRGLLAEARLDTLLVSRLAEALPGLPRAGLLLKSLLGKVDLPPRGTGDSLSRRMAAADPLSEPERSSPEDVALLQYTGGTTGTPKAAQLTHRNLVANVEQCRAWLQPDPARRAVCLLAVPCFHVYGMTTGMNLSVSLGQTMVLHPRFDAGAVARSIERERATQLPGVQTFYQRIVEHPGAGKRDLSSLDVCFSGAGPLLKETADSFEALTGARLVEGYGLTEAAPVTHCNPLRGVRKAGSVGIPFPSTEARVADLETGRRSLGAGEAGELVVRGPQVMLGYWNREEETRQVLRDGWLHTGDVAVMDEDGFFRIVDRKKEMIKSGGENVYPRDVEEALLRHPAVRDAGVVGVADPAFGEKVKAFVVLQPGARATEAELIDFCRGRLSGVQTPKEIGFRDSLPRTGIGKLLRRVLASEEVQSTKYKVG